MQLKGKKGQLGGHAHMEKSPYSRTALKVHHAPRDSKGFDKPCSGETSYVTGSKLTTFKSLKLGCILPSML